jgi:hydrogenase maturation protein HypF
MAACIAEHKLEKPVIGVIYDGTGFGEDGRNWGGEILVGTLAGFTRAGHLKYCLIQGGDKAAEQPWRSAVSYLHGTGSDLVDVSDIDNLACITVKSALLADLNCYESSSMGRLFDCVSALLGLCSIATYDGQAAIILETIADKHISGCYEYKIYEEKDCIIIDYQEIINGILYDIEIGTKASEVSSKFHNTIAAATTEAVVKIGRIHNIREAVLSGGCFENLLLLEKLVKRLEAQGFKVYLNEKLPCNDGGISFGQLAAAARILRG